MDQSVSDSFDPKMPNQDRLVRQLARQTREGLATPCAESCIQRIPLPTGFEPCHQASASECLRFSDEGRPLQLDSSQLAISNKKTRFGPKVASRDWWIERIKIRKPEIRYWTHYTKYQIAQFHPPGHTSAEARRRTGLD